MTTREQPRIDGDEPSGTLVSVDGRIGKFISRSWNAHEQAWYEMVSFEDGEAEAIPMGAKVTLAPVHTDVQARCVEDVLIERVRQIIKFGDQTANSDILWSTILAEEVGEAAKCALHDEFGGQEAHRLYLEVEQVAAVAIAWLEALRERGYRGA